MVYSRYGTIVDGVFTTAGGRNVYASSSPVFIGSLSRDIVVAITLLGEAVPLFFSCDSNYNYNHHAATENKKHATNVRSSMRKT